jgi:hypothetical protein
VVAVVGIETLLHRSGRDVQDPTPRRRLDRFEVQRVRGSRPDQRLDLRDDLNLGCFEAPFFKAVSGASI